MSTATESKHTPGPLYVRSRKGIVHAVATKDHAIIQRTTDDDIAWFNRLEDAVLFKAAPAMLALVEDYLDGKYTDPAAGLMESFDEDARQIVRLAKGESQ